MIDQDFVVKLTNKKICFRGTEYIIISIPEPVRDHITKTDYFVADAVLVKDIEQFHGFVESHITIYEVSWAFLSDYDPLKDKRIHACNWDYPMRVRAKNLL